MDSQIELAKNLCRWFRENKRELEWRKRHPEKAYRVLVSEIMLQQTRVDTVKKYFPRWIEKFPNIESLAKAEFSSVLKLWEGLGYYNRCQKLWNTARFIVQNYQGKIPDSKKELLKLEGIGDYTASAICSLAYNQKIPAIDCNAKRVFSRIYAYKKNIDKKEASDFFSSVSKKLLDFCDAATFNQAIMELGALVCYSHSPRCTFCPIQKNCLAFQKQLVSSIPKKNKKEKPISLMMDYWVIEDKEKKMLVYQQKNARWWNEMWVFPHFFRIKKMQNQDFLNLRNMLKKYKLIKIGNLKHQVTKYKITANFWSLNIQDKVQLESFFSQNNTLFQWVNRENLQNLSLPKPCKYLSQLLIQKQ